MSKHTFENLCINFNELLEEPTLLSMMKAAEAQAHHPTAWEAYDPTYDPTTADSETAFCAQYYGAFTEWLVGAFLTYYGHKFNMHSVEMMDSVGNAEDDLGTDGYALTIKNKPHKDIRLLQHPKDSKVHIQVKGARPANRNKKHQVNDGSRIVNFITNATTSAILNGRAYQDRLVLVTTADGINYKLEQMSNNIMEVISYKKIQRVMKDDYIFLNSLRKQVGLEPLQYDPPRMDPAAEYNEKHPFPVDQEEEA